MTNNSRQLKVLVRDKCPHCNGNALEPRLNGYLEKRCIECLGTGETQMWRSLEDCLGDLVKQGKLLIVRNFTVEGGE